MPRTICVQYTNGAEGGLDAVSPDNRKSLAADAINKNGPNAACTFYSKDNCQGSSFRTFEQCVDGARFGIDHVRSFSCTVKCSH
jgi:hypothetical protein